MKVLSPNIGIGYFVVILRFVVIYTLFGRLLGKKSVFFVKTVFLGEELHYFLVYIAYNIEMNWQIYNYAPKRRICRENSKYAPDEIYCGHFCPRRKAANFCHPDH